MGSTHTELAFQIKQFKFAVKLPKLKFRTPEFLRKRGNKYKIKDIKPSSDLSFSSEDWIKEFNTRYNLINQPSQPDPQDTSFSSINLSKTSTPVCLRIFPLNWTEMSEKKIDFLLDVSGVKIYENVDLIDDENVQL